MYFYKNIKSSIRFGLIMTLILEVYGVLGRKKMSVFEMDTFLEPCSQTYDSVVRIRNSTLKMQDGARSVDYVFEIAEDLNFEYLMVDVQIHKCRSKESSDTCMKYWTLSSKQGCYLLGASDASWSSLIKTCTDPIFKCPIKKGIYYGTNCKWNFSNPSGIPMDLIVPAYYRVTIFVKDPNSNILACLKFRGTLKNVYA